MSKFEKKLWVENYRPQTLNDVILPETLKAEFRKFIEEKQVPHLLLSGQAGTGKTTMARVLANEIGADFYMINGSKESGIDTLRTKVVSYASTTSLEHPGQPKILLIDEADYLNANSFQPALRGIMEEVWENCRFIFTCNYKNRLIPALHSRCTVIDFSFSANDKIEMMGAFMSRCMKILKENNVKFDPKVLAAFIKNHFPDMRRTLNELQRYSTCGTIDEGILKASGQDLIDQIVVFLKNKNFKQMRDWVDMNESIDASVLFDKLYDELTPFLAPQSVPDLILVLDDYQNKAAIVVNQRINLAACLTTLMSTLEFKAS
jgi:DNA polymerase III delta prime subunit